jgi:hypothetical protein
MTGGAAYAKKTLPAPLTELTYTAAVDLAAISGTSSLNFMKLRTASGLAIGEVFVTPTRLIGFRNDVTGGATTSATAYPAGWHVVRLHAVVAGAASSYDVAVDAAPVASLSATLDLGTAAVGQVQIGENVAGRTAEAYYDAVTVTTPTGDPVLAAAGDIACDPLNKNFNGGAGANGVCQQRAVADAILADPSVTTVAALGDVQYECGGAAAFTASYDPSWGRFKTRTRPAVGNHEYIASSTTTPATDCDATGTAAGYFSYFGSLAGQAGKGYYSYELGSWHIVVLNTTCGGAGGCSASSPQGTWLAADLAAHPAQCTLAYYHIPLFSSGGRAAQNSKALVQILQQAGAEVILTGHDHIYERFAPQDADGVATPNGIRAWVVGTGGANHTSIPAGAAPNSEVIDTSSFGYLKLTLHPGSYTWAFVPVGGSFTDSGSATCH